MKKTSILMIIILTLIISACGSKMYTSGDDDGYTLINDVDGVSFGVASKVLGTATAVTNISDSMNFERNQTYMYKNGSTEFLLFNISNLVYAVEKGTTFNMANSSDKEECIKSNNVLGIWFDHPGKKKKFEYEDNTADGVYKMIATVTGEVSITSEIFNDFAGKLVVLSDGETEYSLFVGTLGNDYNELDKDMQKAIEYMAASLTLSDGIVQTDSSEVNIGGSTDEASAQAETSSEVISSTEDISKASNEDISVNAATLDSTTNIDGSEEADTEESAEAASELSVEVNDNNAEEPAVSASTGSSSEEDVVVIIDDDEESVTEASLESSTMASSEEPDENVKEDIKEEKSMGERLKGAAITLNNQKNTIREDNKVYSSTIYDMLKPNIWGYSDILTSSGAQNVTVKVSELLKDSSAVSVIKMACASGQVPYKYFDPPAGCSWHMVKVSLKEATDQYIDVKLVGVDGNSLNFRGIKYPKRTYEIPISDTEKYVYYSVPNGCAEYVLEIGDGTNDNDLNSAYYLIEG